MDSRVEDVPGRRRFEVSVGGELAGFAEYHLHKDLIAFLHTEIGDGYSGQGLASALIKHALDDARGRGLRVQPFCPFVRGYIAKHPEYVDLVDDRERFEL